MRHATNRSGIASAKKSQVYDRSCTVSAAFQSLTALERLAQYLSGQWDRLMASTSLDRASDSEGFQTPQRTAYQPCRRGSMLKISAVSNWFKIHVLAIARPRDGVPVFPLRLQREAYVGQPVLRNLFSIRSPTTRRSSGTWDTRCRFFRSGRICRCACFRTGRQGRKRFPTISYLPNLRLIGVGVHTSGLPR